MYKFIETIIRSQGAPSNKSCLWLDELNGGVMKYWKGQDWVPIAGSSPGPDYSIVGEIVGTV